MATTDSCNLSPTWKRPMETAPAGWRWEQEIDLGEDWLVLWMCAGGRVLCCALSLSLQPQLLPSLAWEIQMNKAAIPLHLGGAHSQTSARSLAEYWNIWLRTKRIRREPEFLCACSSRSVSCLPGCSIKDLSVTKYFVSLWTFIETQAP